MIDRRISRAGAIRAAYTKSAGTIMPTAGNEILIQPNAGLAFIDPQNF
jgi:hypothetical protein